MTMTQVEGQTRHYVPLNGGFERLDGSGVPLGWNLSSSTGSDGLDTFCEASPQCAAGLHGVKLGSRGTGTATARTLVRVEFVDLRMLYLGTARFSYKVLCSALGGRNLQFRLVLRDAENQTVYTQEFVPPQGHVGDGRWHFHNFTVDIRESRTARYLLLEFSVNKGAEKGEGEWIVDELRIFDMGPAVHIGEPRCSRSLLRSGEETIISFNVTNNGGAPLYSMTSELDIRGGISVQGSSYVELPVVEPGMTYEVSWSLVAEERGPCLVTAISTLEGNLSGGEHSSTLILGVGEFSHPPERPDEAAALTSEQEVVLENEYIRLVFPRSGDGYGLLDVQCWNGSWRSMAVSIPIGYAVYLTNSGAQEVLLLTPSSSEVGGNSSTKWASFTGSALDKDAVEWEFSYLFYLSNGDPSVKVHMEVSASRTRRLLRLNGPTLLAGEGSFGSERGKALFCGLEYLLEGEKSSGTDFVKAPKNVRAVPHPLKITIPLMAVESGNATVALSWDPLQRWDGHNQYPSAEFWSPNWPKNQSNHIMSVFLPSVPAWVKENEEQASTPYEMGDSPLILTMDIFAKANCGVTDSIVWWLNKRGVPSRPPMPRSLQETLDLCAHCFKDICWVPGLKAWKHTHLNDPRWIFWDPLVALALWHYSALTDNTTLRSEIRDQVLEAYEAAGARGDGLDLALHMGDVEDSLVQSYSQVNALVDSQMEDGSWPFTSDPKHEELGRPGDTSTGWVANKALFLLKFGRITGDTEAISSGLKGLKYLDSQARPEGAQTWELQLHVPDVLASAYLVGCYVEAYRITGDRHYLQKARYWALTGLPFIYMWNSTDRPIMRYASIPVFGASWYTHPWFGIAVQWNGLEYAYHLYELSTVDEYLPWRTISEGITVCGMQMQRYLGGPHEEVVGMYPDAYSVVDGRDAYYFDLNPRLIAQCAFALAGSDEMAQTSIVRTSHGTIHVTAVGDLGNATLSNGLLEFDNSYPQGDTSYVIVGGISPPESITVNGHRLENVDDLSQVEQGWRYRDEGILVLKILHSEADHVEVAGIHPRPSSRFSEKSSWEFSEDKDGWMAANMLAGLRVQNGTLVTRSTGSDPYMIGPRVKIKASREDLAVIKMRVTRGSSAQLFWTRSDSRYFSEEKSVRFPVQADGLFHIYTLGLGNNSEWKDTVTQLRFDPTDAADTEIEIDYIRIPEQIWVALMSLSSALALRPRGPQVHHDPRQDNH